jgi:hypothetical protein
MARSHVQVATTSTPARAGCRDAVAVIVAYVPFGVALGATLAVLRHRTLGACEELAGASSQPGAAGTTSRPRVIWPIGVHAGTRGATGPGG